MKRTGVYLPLDQFQEVQRLLRPKIKVNLSTNTTITEPGDRAAACKLINDFAKANGLPDLPESGNYGLTGERELVAPE